MNYVTVVSEDSKSDIQICGNERPDRGVLKVTVPLNNDSIVIRVCWRDDDDSPEEYIGTFVLHFDELLEKNLIQKIKAGWAIVKFINYGGAIVLAKTKSAIEANDKEKTYLLIGARKGGKPNFRGK